MQLQLKVKSRKKLPMHLSKGMNYNDQIILKIIMDFFKAKMRILFKFLFMKEKEDKVWEILEFAKKIIKRKTFR